MNFLRTFLGLLLAASAFAADVLPANRRVDKLAGASDGYGVPGGIYQYRGRTIVNATGLTDLTGGTDYSGTIQSQLDALSPGQCLLLPAGIIRLNNNINIGVASGNAKANPNITLRGAGMGQTILMVYGGASVSCSGGGGWPTNYPTALYLAADTPAGSTTITLTGTVVGNPNQNFVIDGFHDPTVPVLISGGGDQVRPVYLRMTGVSGNTATFWPPLPFAMKAGARYTTETGTGAPNYITSVQGIGLEDLTVDGANGTGTPVGMYSTRQSWIYNVEVKNVTNFGISAAFNLQSSILHCTVHHHKPSYPSISTRNLVTVALSTLMLVEDNIVHSGYSAFELNAGVTLSAFSHNLTDRICVDQAGVLASDFNINHGPHNSFNVYEGNITSRIQSDGYFGSSSHEIFHRNWFHGTLGVHTTGWDVGNTITGNRLPITLNRFAHFFSIVGNQIGRTGAGVTWAYSNVGPGFDTTCSNTLTISAEEKIVTLGTGLNYSNNGTHALFFVPGDNTKWMQGRVLDYNPATGTCRVTVNRTSGSGTYSNWVVLGGGGYGNDTLYALGGPNIGNGGYNLDLGIAAPQTRNLWWKCWDGRRTVRRGNFNGGTVYSQTGSGPTGVADTVYYYADPPPGFSGGSITDWIANNPAKSGTATWATPGPNQTDWLPLASNSYQELDYDSYGTAIIKDNWNAATNGIHASEAIGSDTYPVSRIRSGSTRPAFFGSSGNGLRYPAFDSRDPQQSFTAIPAGYRYMNNGAEVPGYSMDDTVAGVSQAPQPRAPTAWPIISEVR